jgi:hypothetical protein
VGPRAGLDRCVKFRPLRDWIPTPSSPQRVAIPTAIPAHCDYFFRKTSLAVVWHVKRHGLVETYRSFGGNLCFRVQSTRVSIQFVLPVVGSSFGLVVRQWAGNSKYRVLILSDNSRVSLPTHTLARRMGSDPAASDGRHNNDLYISCFVIQFTPDGSTGF